MGSGGTVPQTVSFTKTAPTPTAGKSPYTVSASASSGLAPLLSIAPASKAVCWLDGETVSFYRAGLCTINADQPGSANYAAAPRVQQSFSVAEAVTTAQSVPSASLQVDTPATAFMPVTATGGVGPLGYAVAPTLPAGLVFSTLTGEITGTPTAAQAETTYTVTVEDSNGSSDSKSFSLSVTDAPAVQFAASGARTTVGRAGISVTATFSVPVTGFELTDITVSNGAASSISGTGATYQFNVTPDANGPVTVDVASGVAQDSNAKDNTPATQLALTADIDDPSVSLTTPAQLVKGLFTVTATFSETVSGFAEGDVTAGNGDVSNFSGSGSTYTFDVTPAGDGAVTVDLAGAVAKDGAGNDNTTATQLSVTADLTAPSVALTTSAASPVSGGFSVTATFSESVDGFVSDDVSVGNGVVSDFLGSGAVYTFLVTPTAGGAVTVDVAAAVAADGAGNGNTASTQLGITADLAAPTVTLTTLSNIVKEAFVVTVTFSEAVTGFDSGDLTFGNGSVSGFSGSGASYSFTVTPSIDGAVTVDVAEGAAHDEADNASSAATQLGVTADLTVPTVVLSAGAALVNGVFTVTATFSEAVTGLALGDVSVGNGDASNLAGSGAIYSFDVTPVSTGAVTVDLGPGVAIDAAGNGNAVADQLSITADLTPPSVALATASDLVNGVFSVTATFSETVSGLAGADISVGNGVASNLQGSGASYSFDVTPTSDGTVTVDVAAADDGAGNGNTAATQLGVTADLIAPGVTITSNVTSLKAGETATITITFSEAVSGFVVEDISTSGGALSQLAVNANEAAIYTALFTPTADLAGALSVVIAAGSYTDAAGNGGTAGTSPEVSIDTLVPGVTIGGPSGLVTAPLTATITFSEAVTGFDVADLSVSQATAGNLVVVTADTVFTVEITPVLGQTVNLSVPANVALDAAGNGNEASPAYSVSAGSPQSAFDQYEQDVLSIIQAQAVSKMSVSMAANAGMMQAARNRFMAASGSTGEAQAGAMLNGFEAIPFDVDGGIDVSGDITGIIAATSGDFLGQTGLVNGVNWRVSGTFDVLTDDKGNWLGALDGRVAREHFLSDGVLLGGFLGGQLSNSDLSDSFTGSESTWQLYAGTYAVTRLGDHLFVDGYASAGYGWSALDIHNDELALEGDYDIFSWQLGGSLTGVMDFSNFSLLPSVSIGYGNSDIGKIDFTATAYGLTDEVSTDARNVAMGLLRVTPEMRIPLGRDGSATAATSLRLLPSFICQHVIAEEAETECGWGAGVRFIQAGRESAGEFSGRFDFEQVGGVNHMGGEIGYAIRF